MECEITTVDAMIAFGCRLGSLCHGGEVIELVGDIGAGKTTLTKGIAAGMGVDDEVQSPTFTLSRTYHTKNGGILAHYDFYRLNDPGILGIELADAAQSADTTIVIEWADTVQHVLPQDRVTLSINALSEEGRRVNLKAGGPHSQKLVEMMS